MKGIMLPSMPLISTPMKEGQIEESCSNDQNDFSFKALDLSLSTKKSSPLKHVTPILRKYNTQRKGKGGKKIGPQNDQMQTLRPIAPKTVMLVIAPTQEDPPREPGSDVKQERAETPDTNKQDKTEEDKNGTDSEAELAALMKASTTVQSAKGRSSAVARKKAKQLKDMQSSVMLLSPDDPVVREQKSYGFAQAYFLKVKERLAGTEQYQAFLHTMNEFGTSILEVRDLYYKVTSLLSQHPDLSEEFLAFLLPEQAMQCGKLMEYLMITRMRDFFRKLERYFEKQPHQMRKFYSALSSLCDQGDVSLTDVRSAILPLLKGNSVLTDYFLSLLPEEKLPDSMKTDFEDMEIGDCDTFTDEDMFETMVVPNEPDTFGGENCPCSCHKTSPDSKTAHCVSCGTKFIHGKVFMQTGKALRPAKIQFDNESREQTIKRLSVNTKPKIKTEKRAQNRLGNSPPKRAHVASSSTPPKGSRTCKTKSGQKSRAVKPCRRLIKPKSERSSRDAKPKAKRTSSRSGVSRSRVSLASEVSVVSNVGTNVISDSAVVSMEESSSVPDISTNVLSHVAIVSTEDPSPVVIVSTPPAPDTSTNVTSPVAIASTQDLSLVPEVSTEVTSHDPLPVPVDVSPEVSSSVPIVALPIDVVSADIPTSCDSIPHDESAMLPADIETSDSAMKDFSLLSSVLHEGSSSLSPVLQTEEADVSNSEVSEEKDTCAEVMDIEIECEEVLSSAWTRDEDKVILQMYKMEHSFQEISEHLPHRSVDEIQARFEILINIMKQLSEEKMEEDIG